MFHYKTFLFIACAVYTLLAWFSISLATQRNVSQDYLIEHQLSGFSDTVDINSKNVSDLNLHKRSKRSILQRIMSHITGTDTDDQVNPLSDTNQGRAAPDTATWAKPPGYNQVPANAFVAGISNTGRKVYIGKGRYPGYDKGMLPGAVTLDSICLHVAVSGYGHCLKNYEILTGSHYEWIPAFQKNFLEKPRLLSGLSDIQGTRVQVCRFLIRTNFDTTYAVIGKAKNDGQCDAAFEGRESIYYNLFEVLTLKE